MQKTRDDNYVGGVVTKFISKTISNKNVFNRLRVIMSQKRGKTHHRLLRMRRLTQIK